MPFINQAACFPSDECPEVAFPQAPAQCLATFAVGGVNDVYVIPCTQVMSENNILDLDWWQSLVDQGILGAVGAGLGSIGKKSDKSERVESCGLEEKTQIIWALKYVLKKVDKTSARTTQNQINTLLRNGGHYLIIARMCDGENEVLPIGRFSTTDLNWTVPDNFEENQTFEFEVSWIEFGIPIPITVANLSTIVPKARTGVPSPGASNS